MSDEVILTADDVRDLLAIVAKLDDPDMVHDGLAYVRFHPEYLSDRLRSALECWRATPIGADFPLVIQGPSMSEILGGLR